MASIYWGDFTKFIDENKRDGRVLKYYKSANGYANTISIVDYSLPRRATHIHTGYDESDWYRDSYVCNASVFNGFIPLYDTIPVYNDETHKWETKQVTGAISTVRDLVSQGVVRRTDEVDDLLTNHRWKGV